LTTETKTIACPGCGASVPDIDGPVHAYVRCSPGCWRTLGELQADEALRFRYPPAHRVVVDSYMAQHPGDGSDRRDRQSVFVHLVGLCAVVEHDAPAGYARKLPGLVIQGHDDFPVLERAHCPGKLTVLHMLGAADITDYARRAREWATAVWDSWSAQHEVIRTALRDVTNPERS
jgi:hypothetical protein